jgi:hypothetical protein
MAVRVTKQRTNLYHAWIGLASVSMAMCTIWSAFWLNANLSLVGIQGNNTLTNTNPTSLPSVLCSHNDICSLILFHFWFLNYMCRAMSRDIGTGLWVTVNAGLMTPPLFEAIIVLYLAFTLTLRGNNIHKYSLTFLE